uniref:C1q domain-containing protein n=1 Tax=Neogobius melanostomus TaxID=47308 RepID=A0A8C6WII7_9GOBI
MMKITVLVFLISCAVCGAQDTPDLMDRVAQLEKELTELKTQVYLMLLCCENISGTPKVAFSAYNIGSGNTGPFNVDTPLKYKSLFSNIGNNYNPVTGMFTATVKGLYFFRFSMHNSHQANSVVSLMKNDVRVASVYDTYASDFHDIGSNAAVLPLEVGDMVYDDVMNYHTFTGFLLFTN